MPYTTKTPEMEKLEEYATVYQEIGIPYLNLLFRLTGLAREGNVETPYDLEAIGGEIAAYITALEKYLDREDPLIKTVAEQYMERTGNLDDAYKALAVLIDIRSGISAEGAPEYVERARKAAEKASEIRSGLGS